MLSCFLVCFPEPIYLIKLLLPCFLGVLRVVGDIRVNSGSSTLKKLATFSERNGLVVSAEHIDSIFWGRKWNFEHCLWRPLMTAKFQHCLKNLSWERRNLALNVLLAVATPDMTVLRQNKSIESAHPRWHMHGLRNVYIAWIAQKFENEDVSNPRVGQVVAHYAGTREECIQVSSRALSGGHKVGTASQWKWIRQVHDTAMFDSNHVSIPSFKIQHSFLLRHA